MMATLALNVLNPEDEFQVWYKIQYLFHVYVFSTTIYYSYNFLFQIFYLIKKIRFSRP